MGKNKTTEKTNIPEKCLNCRWLSPRMWCIIGSFPLTTLDRQVPLLRELQGDRQRKKKAIALVNQQQNVWEFVCNCKTANTDRATPITHREYCITRYAKGDPSKAVVYEQMSNEEIARRFADYCAHPASMGNGETTLYGIMWWELSRCYPQTRFINPVNRTVYRMIPEWLASVRSTGGLH